MVQQRISCQTNGGQFINERFLKLSEAFRITIKTTSAELPWSNGLVEWHSLVLAEMLNKVLENTNCHFDIALHGVVNAKSSLHNVHGFSPYQLALGQNPRLPAVLSDKPRACDSNPSSEII